MPEIREETDADPPFIRRVNRLAFQRENEARLVDRLRADGLVIASLVAVREGQVVGHILFSELSVETERRAIPAAALGPMSVLPKMQRQGIGSALVREGIAMCQTRGVGLIVVLGRPSYYARFGFSSALAKGLRGPFSGEAFMALELASGVLEGAGATVKYPRAFEFVE